jgi:hypothetical protein
MIFCKIEQAHRGKLHQNYTRSYTFICGIHDTTQKRPANHHLAGLYIFLHRYPEVPSGFEPL